MRGVLGRGRRWWRAALALALLVGMLGSWLPRATPTLAATVIDTRPPDFSVGPFGPGGTTTYGQVVTAPTDDTVLRSFLFLASQQQLGPLLVRGDLALGDLTVRGEVYAWDGTKATGAPLFQSGPLSLGDAPTANDYLVLAFETGGLPLLGGGAYVLVITTLRDANDTGGARLGFRPDNPYPGGGAYATSASDLTSGPWEELTGGDFAIAATFGATPPPILTSVTPNTAPAGSADTVVTLTGQQFTAGSPGTSSYAVLDGTPLASTVLSATQLRATIPASLLTTAGQRALTVSTPGQGGTSNPLPFTISGPPAGGQVAVTATAQGQGSVTPAGVTSYATGSVATYAATPGAGQLFLGWTLDGQYVGYASPLTFTVNGNRTLVATFAARPSFNDVPSTDPDYEAIARLAALGIVNPQGADGAGNFQPARSVARAEIAAFIARLFGWQREFHRNTFPDRCAPDGGGCVDDELWNNVAALADYGVVGGYTDDATCGSAGTTAPCYLPRDPVSRLQVVSIVARAFTKTPDLRPTGYWDRLPAVQGQYANVPDGGTQRSDLATYRQNAGPIPGQAGDGQFPDPAGAASRRFVIEVLSQAYSAQFGVDRVP